MPDKPEITDIDPFAGHVEDLIDKAGAALGSLFKSTTVGTGEEDRTSDSDGDGITDWNERHVHGTDPSRSDTDGDGLGDGFELEYGTDPTDGDSDSDGLSDGEELRLGADPLSWDTDGDGWSDGMEVRYTNTDPLRRDTDGDGLTDRDEGMVHRTDPNKRDSDGDGIGDGAEVAFDNGTWMDGEATSFDGAEDTTLDAAAGEVIEESLAEQALTTVEQAPLAADTAALPANDFRPDMPTEALPPNPIHNAAVSEWEPEVATEVALPPNPIHNAAVSEWEPEAATEVALPPNPIDNFDVDGLEGIGDPLFTPTGIDDNAGEAVSAFEPGGVDTELDFGG